MVAMLLSRSQSVPYGKAGRKISVSPDRSFSFSAPLTTYLGECTKEPPGYPKLGRVGRLGPFLFLDLIHPSRDGTSVVSHVELCVCLFVCVYGERKRVKRQEEGMKRTSCQRRWREKREYNV